MLITFIDKYFLRDAMQLNIGWRIALWGAVLIALLVFAYVLWALVWWGSIL
jgi:hypothetical protein